MATVYENFDGHEAAQVLAESFGLAPQTKQQLPRLRECPNVTYKELNTPEAPFCRQCRIPLSVAGHLEREQEILELKEQMSQMMQTFESYHGLAKERMNQMDNSIRFLTDEITKYRGQFGPRPLTETERNMIDIFRKQLENIPDDDMVTNE